MAFCLRIDSLWSRYFRQWTINISFTAFVIFSVSISFQFKRHFFPHSLFLQLFLFFSCFLKVCIISISILPTHFITSFIRSHLISSLIHQIYLHTFSMILVSKFILLYHPVYSLLHSSSHWLLLPIFFAHSCLL